MLLTAWKYSIVYKNVNSEMMQKRPKNSGFLTRDSKPECRRHFWTLDNLPSTLDIFPRPSTYYPRPSTLDKNLYSSQELLKQTTQTIGNCFLALIIRLLQRRKKKEWQNMAFLGANLKQQRVNLESKLWRRIFSSYFSQLTRCHIDC